MTGKLMLETALKLIGDRIQDYKKIHDWKITRLEDWAGNDEIPAVCMAVVAEISEAYEAFRKNDIDNFKEELADVIIRIIGLCHGMGINLATEIFKKMDKNDTRPYKNGGKRV